jgi:hypothetical protein
VLENNRVALVWRGDREARDRVDLEANRLRRVAEALRSVGLTPEPAVYADDFAHEVREQLLMAAGVLVWVNPIEKDRDRSILDDVLRDVAARGILVSAHPDVILKMGTKAVLFETRDMGWGCDTHCYTTAEELREQFPRRLAEGRPRVLKQYRGNGGNGVWLVKPSPGGSAQPGIMLRVQHALPGCIEETITQEEFLTRCAVYFAGTGRIIDQAYQERLPEGMIRCYLVRDRLVGFGFQQINALHPAPDGAPPEEAPRPGPRLYYPPTRPDFQPLRIRLEEEWMPALLTRLGVHAESLPVIWDADFLFGPKTESGVDTYVLCEINVSSVYPFPDEALEPLGRETLARLRASQRRGS